jgi:hypothetical protein
MVAGARREARPWRGSRWRPLGIRLIRLPFRVLESIPTAFIAAVAPNNDPRKFRPPTSIQGLSPKNPLLISLDKLPINAPHNSIIGDRGRHDSAKQLRWSSSLLEFPPRLGAVRTDCTNRTWRDGPPGCGEGDMSNPARRDWHRQSMQATAKSSALRHQLIARKIIG